jgi:hypothetical protein
VTIDDGPVPGTKDRFDTYCPQCERWVSFDGEVLEANDGTKGAQGPCPECGTIVTAMLARSRPGA